MESSLTNACTIRIPDFEGPFDLLFHLIEKNKVSIYDIPINVIADQYMKYLFDMQQLNLEIASEFLVVASTLLYIKSRMLLPGKQPLDEEGPDPREDLISRLIEYRRYKDAAAALKENARIWSGSYCRISDNAEPEALNPAIVITAGQLMRIYNELAQRNERRINRNITRIEDYVVREKISVRLKMKQILKHFTNKRIVSFDEVFSLNRHTKAEIVVGFIAMLELTKMKRILLEQKKLFSSIFMKKHGRETRNE